MPNRQLTPGELESLFRPLYAEVNLRLSQLAAGDAELLWALRRKLAKELSYQERGKPMLRRALKMKKRLEQNNRCALCSIALPESDVILDRVEAMAGYTVENTRLLCRICDFKVQKSRGFK